MKSEEGNSHFHLHGMLEIMEDNLDVHLDNGTKTTKQTTNPAEARLEVHARIYFLSREQI
jgi:hypothetical protein